jgi:Na+-driven multidrug efflux pump
MALAAAVSSMAAQNVGARLWRRVDRIALSGALSGFVATALIATLIYALGDLTLHIFLPAHSPAMPVALHINHLVLWGFTLSSISFALSGVVRATGAVWAPLGIMVVSMYVIAIPFVMLLSPHFGANAIWFSFPLGAVITMLLNVAYYRWGNWRSVHMLGGPQPGDAAFDAADAGLATPVLAEAEAAPAE